MELILYSSAACAPCKALKANLMKLQETHKFKLKVVEANIHTQKEFINRGIRAVPTLLVMKDDELTESTRIVGELSLPALESKLRAAKVFP